MKILITSGATREPIDAVRFISNLSTGRTGAALADALVSAGHEVSLLRGQGALEANFTQDQELFGTAADLLARMSSRLASGSFDAVLMAAAVSDYRPERPEMGKLSSAVERFDLPLVRTPKILPILRALSPRSLRVAGFKLTVRAGLSERTSAVREQFESGGVDLVVHNDLAEIAAEKDHPFWLYSAADAAPVSCRGPSALAKALERAL